MNAVAGGIGTVEKNCGSRALVTKRYNFCIVTSKAFWIGWTGWTWGSAEVLFLKIHRVRFQVLCSRPSFTSKVGFSVWAIGYERRVHKCHWSSLIFIFTIFSRFWGPRPCSCVFEPRIVHGPRGSETRQRRHGSHGDLADMGLSEVLHEWQPQACFT